MSLQRLAHVALRVDDLDAALEFYGRVLGLVELGGRTGRLTSQAVPTRAGTSRSRRAGGVSTTLPSWRRARRTWRRRRPRLRTPA